MNLTIEELFRFIHGFDEFFGDRVQSAHPSDNPVYRIKIVPYDIGQRIYQEDPDESHFHVIFFPPHKAEVWAVEAWNESLTKRLRNILAATKVEQTPDEIIRADLLHSLIAFYRSIGLTYKLAHQTADHLLSTKDPSAVLSISFLPDTLATKLHEYRNRNNTTEDPSEGHSEGQHNGGQCEGPVHGREN